MVTTPSLVFGVCLEVCAHGLGYGSGGLGLHLTYTHTRTQIKLD